MTTIEEERDEAINVMTKRAREQNCVFCGKELPDDIKNALGRICSSCLPPDSSPAMEMAKKLGFRRPSDAKNSYWVIENQFGSYGLIFRREDS